MTSPIMGWDLGSGRVLPLPVSTPGEITLVKAGPDLPSSTTPATKTTELQIWGFHPCLLIVVAFYKRLRVGKSPSASPIASSELGGKLQAFPLVKTSNPQDPSHALPEIPASKWFLFGGQLEDGFEGNTGMQAVRILVTATVDGPFDHDLVCSVQVKQAQPLGCVDLANALIEQVRVEPGPPIQFTDETLE
jgi:hypothetical protein